MYFIACGCRCEQQQHELQAQTQATNGNNSCRHQDMLQTQQKVYQLMLHMCAHTI
jgi:hypothetical protein